MATHSEQYLIAGLIFVFVCIVIFVSLLLVTLTAVGGPSFEHMLTSWWYYMSLFLASAAAFCGILGGYFIGVYIEMRRAARNPPPPT